MFDLYAHLFDRRNLTTANCSLPDALKVDAPTADQQNRTLD